MVVDDGSLYCVGHTKQFLVIFLVLFLFFFVVFFVHFFFNDTATTEIYTLSLHDALPICPKSAAPVVMLHGNPSWSFYYRKLVTALCKHYRCIVPDHIGMGFSDKPSAGEYEFTLEIGRAHV